jgi:hypothetical protein
MSRILRNNWFKKAMPLIDDNIDGGIFDSDGPYSPDTADFVEMPFAWLSSIHDGDLNRRLQFMLENLSGKYPHLPVAKIAEAINIGVTRNIEEICSHHAASIYPEKIDFDCENILNMSPVREKASDYGGYVNELASIVQDKMNGYFNYYR